MIYNIPMLESILILTLIYGIFLRPELALAALVVGAIVGIIIGLHKRSKDRQGSSVERL